jgi:hypothetical protein
MDLGYIKPTKRYLEIFEGKEKEGIKKKTTLKFILILLEVKVNFLTDKTKI